jgi:hypothetical protein
MVLDLNENDLLKEDLNREKRFDEKYLVNLEDLVSEVSKEIVYQSGAGLNLAKKLNSFFALFLRNLFNIMDRGYILQRIDQYLKISLKLGF